MYELFCCSSVEFYHIFVNFYYVALIARLVLVEKALVIGVEIDSIPFMYVSIYINWHRNRITDAQNNK